VAMLCSAARAFMARVREMDRERARGTKGKKEGKHSVFTVRVDDAWARGGYHAASEDDMRRAWPEPYRP
jgi:hypothetical protein